MPLLSFIKQFKKIFGTSGTTGPVIQYRISENMNTSKIFVLNWKHIKYVITAF